MNQDTIVLLHILHNHRYFKVVEGDFFDNKAHAGLFEISKKYHSEYGKLPFDIGSPKVSLEQLSHYIDATDTYVEVDSLRTKEENKDIFLMSCKGILEYPYADIDQIYLVGSNGQGGAFHEWLKFKSFIYGLNKATRFVKQKRDLGEIKGDNVNHIIKTSLDIINDRGNLNLSRNEGYSFMDPEGHQQVSPENLIRTGYRYLDIWLGDDGHEGGLEPGTLTFIWGASNVGKSIWVANLAANFMTSGNNVLIISNEMKEHKIMRRLGSNVLDINVNKYAAFAGDHARMVSKLNDGYQKASGMLVPWGTLWVVQIPKCSPSQVEYKAKELEKKLGIKFHVVLIDYFTNMGNDHGVSPADMYIYHKNNADDLYATAGTNDWAIVTPHQIKISEYDVDDISLSSGGESSGIVQPADNIWGIIQTPLMKTERRYWLKNLKGRESAYKNYRAGFKVDYDYMRITSTDEHENPDDNFFM